MQLPSDLKYWEILPLPYPSHCIISNRIVQVDWHGAGWMNEINQSKGLLLLRFKRPNTLSVCMVWVNNDYSAYKKPFRIANWVFVATPLQFQHDHWTALATTQVFFVVWFSPNFSYKIQPGTKHAHTQVDANSVSIVFLYACSLLLFTVPKSYNYCCPKELCYVHNIFNCPNRTFAGNASIPPFSRLLANDRKATVVQRVVS